MREGGGMVRGGRGSMGKWRGWKEGLRRGVDVVGWWEGTGGAAGICKGV